MTEQFPTNDPLAALVGEENNILDEVLTEEIQAALPEADAGTAFIRVVTTSGSVNVPISLDHTFNGVPGYSVTEVLNLANIYMQAGSVIWVNGTAVEPDYILTGGQGLTVVGPAKGG